MQAEATLDRINRTKTQLAALSASTRDAAQNNGFQFIKQGRIRPSTSCFVKLFRSKQRERSIRNALYVEYKQRVNKIQKLCQWYNTLKGNDDSVAQAVSHGIGTLTPNLVQDASNKRTSLDCLGYAIWQEMRDLQQFVAHSRKCLSSKIKDETIDKLRNDSLILAASVKTFANNPIHTQLQACYLQLEDLRRLSNDVPRISDICFSASDQFMRQDYQRYVGRYRISALMFGRMDAGTDLLLKISKGVNQFGWDPNKNNFSKLRAKSKQAVALQVVYTEGLMRVLYKVLHTNGPKSQLQEWKEQKNFLQTVVMPEMTLPWLSSPGVLRLYNSVIYEMDKHFGLNRASISSFIP